MICETGGIKLPVQEVIEKIWNTRNFDVGGGAASSIAGSMAAGLGGMVARLSIGKNHGLEDIEYEKIACKMDSLCQDLISGAIEDEQAFLGIRAAFSLPRGSEEEKIKRRDAVENAAVKAAEVPLENGKMAARVLDLCRNLVGCSNPAAGSDLDVGMMLARAAVRGCALNIDANLPLIRSPEKNNLLREASEDLKNLRG
jgi:formiminotetrahydrofolate cyclodeaminase